MDVDSFHHAYSLTYDLVPIRVPWKSFLLNIEPALRTKLLDQR